MLEKLFDELIEGIEIEDLEIDEQLIQDILEDAAQADTNDIRDLGIAAARLDEHIQKFMGKEQSSVASKLSAEYEYEARLNGFILGFKAAMQLMDRVDPGARV